MGRSAAPRDDRRARVPLRARSRSSSLYAFNGDRGQILADHRLDRPSWFGRALGNPTLRMRSSCRSRRARRDHRSPWCSGTLAALRRPPLPVLRAGDDLVRCSSCRSPCPGIVTGMALNATYQHARHRRSAVCTIIIGHATFCVVVVYNNVDRPDAPVVALDRGGVDGPRGGHAPDVPLRHLPGRPDGPGRGRACWRSRSPSTRSS